MLIIGLSFCAIHIESVQTFLAKRMAAYLSSQLKTKVSVDKVSIQFVKSIVLKGLYVEDLHGDTLLYTDELNVSINDISTEKKSLKIGRMVLQRGQFNLVRYHGEQSDNMQFLVDYFSSTDTGKVSSPWNVTVENIFLKEVSFRHNAEDDTTNVNGVNFSHLDVRVINGDFKNFSTINDSVFVNIHSLSLVDKSGFKLDNFSADAKISDTEIRLKKLSIQTPLTDIHTDLVFQYEDFSSFDEFTSKVKWNSDFHNSKVSFTDIAYFAPDLAGIDKSIILDGKFHGSIKNFHGKNVTLKWGEHSLFRGDISMNGLPYIDNTYIELSANEISTTKKDVEWLPLPPFDKKLHPVIPANLEALGHVVFKGRFTGFISDFVAFGNVSTDIGSISSDLNLKYNKKNKSSEYIGHLAASQFDVGKITGSPDLGKVTFSFNINGSGLRLDNINSKLDGKISELEFKKYNYKNIDVNGEFAKKLFSGSLSVNEPNVDFNFKGTVDYRSKLPMFNFIADIKSAQLDTLHLFKTTDRTILQTSISTQFSGDKLDNIVGNISVSNTNFITGKKLFHINSIELKAEINSGIHTFDIVSDNFDAHFKGEFELAKLGDSFKEILPRYLPSVILPQKSFQSNQNFTYDIRIKNLNVFTEILFPLWEFAPNTTLSGHFNSNRNDLALDINTSWIHYKNFSLDDFYIHALSGNNDLSLKAGAHRISNNGDNFILLPQLTAQAINNRINYKLDLANVDSSSNRAHLSGIIDFFSASHFNMKIDTSNLTIENQKWVLDTNNLLSFDSSAISFSALRFSRLNEFVQINGSISRKETDRLELKLSDFNLNHINSFLSSGKEAIFGGIISGDIFLTDAYHQFQLESDIHILNFTVDKDTIGNASIVSRFNSDQNVVAANVGIMKGQAKIIDVSGNYYVNRDNNNLDFNLKLNNLYLHPLERYIDDVMREVYGKVSGDLKLTGTLQRPVFNGTLDLNKTSLIVNYLNTRYSFSNKFYVKENEFDIGNLKIVDVNNNEGIATGKIYHNYFKNFRFDVELQAKRLQVLNTTIKDNSLYYGLANGSGYAHFYGPLERMNMDISMSSEKGTTVNIPLNTSEDLISSNFISFINHSTDSSLNLARNNVDLSGVRLNMNLEMNQNANINIIFDEKIGDVISGTGKGDLKLDINSSGNFNMYGTYTIDRGEYLFTLQNLINKKFNIDPGSTITWAGDPYEAIVNLSAYYVVYTSTLYNVLQDTTNKRRVPVDCRLFLTNKLMNPTISYEIKVRGLSPTDEGLMSTILNSEQEINRQMFGLLILNQFLPVNGSGQTVARIDAGAGAGASASELLSNQVSNWLGQLSKDVSIGFNYRAKDTYTNEEVQLMFTKSLFNERLTLEGNLGYLNDQTYVNSNVVGDFYAEYKVSEDGRFRLKGFNRSNADNIINFSQAPYSQGFGIFYRQEFNTIKDILVRWRLKHKDDEAPKL